MEKKSAAAHESVRAIIDLWPSRRALSEQIGTSEARIHKWAQVNAIPARYQKHVIAAAAARGFEGVTAELIVALHALPDACAKVEAAE